MLQYYNDITAVNLELVILSGGIAVTGRNPFMMIWSPDFSLYFDFVSRSFTAVPGNTAQLLTSALDGIYRANWDVSGLFNSSSGTFLNFEYYDDTAVTTEQVLFSPKPRIDIAAAGGGITRIQGVWTAKQKKKLFDEIDDIQKKIDDLKKQTITLLRNILGKKSLKKEDLDFIKTFQEEYADMWQEIKKPLLKMLDLKDSASMEELYKKLEEYNKVEEADKQEIMEKFNQLLNKPKPEINEEDGDDDE